MADQHQTQTAAYPFLLDSSAISIDISASTQGHQVQQEQGHDQGHIQGQVRVSSDNSGATQAPFMYGFTHASQQQHYANQMHQGSPTGHVGQELTLDPAQLRTSSIGPNRVLTRRQARMQGAHPYESAPQEDHQQQGQQLNEAFGQFGADANSPRPQTPNGFHTGAQLPGARIEIPDLNMAQISLPSAPTMSPQHPGTPASVTSSSNFSHYGFAQYPHSRHSRSDSNSTQPRSASPAVSTVSAVTSLSSGSKRRPKTNRSRRTISSVLTDDQHMGTITPSPTELSLPKPKPKRRLSDRQRKEICQYFKEHPNSRQEDIALRWGVERSTISKILKHKNRWMAVTDARDPNLAKHRPPKFAAIEMGLGSWLRECRDTKTLISDAMIRTKARETAEYMGISEEKFKASSGWVENFKQRAGIKRGILVGRPDPGFYTDDEEDEDCLYLHELIEARRQAQELREEQERLAAEARELGVNIPGLQPESSSVALNAADGWVPSMGFTPGIPNPRNSTNHVPGQAESNQPFSGRGFFPQHTAPSQDTTMGEGTTPAANDPSGQQPVNPHEAKSAMDVVLRFVQAQEPNFLTEQDMNILTDIKHLIWVTVNNANRQAMASTVANPTPNVATNIQGGASENNNMVGGVLSSANAVPGGQPITA